MKKYRLKQWYPSLPKNNKNKETLKEGSIVEIYKDDSNYFYFQFFDCCLNKLGFHYLSEEEISSDFWELIEEEKPLFTTYDGVQVTDGYMGMILVCRDLSKSFRYAKDCRVDTVEASTKIFAHESNADEYIWKNKPLLSVKDVVDNCVNLSYAENIELIELAKERSKE